VDGWNLVLSSLVRITFIPKILATVVVMVVGGPWMLDQLLSYTRDLWASIPSLIG
jgi:flagellar biosynthetic protein FliQ